MARPRRGAARRELHDPRALRALAHPFRLTLLDLLAERGTLTSKQASEATAASTASCSFHLRQLAKYGFVEPAEAADGRERPWRRVPGGERVPDTNDRALRRAAAGTTAVMLDRVVGEAAAWLDASSTLPRAWRRAGVIDEELLFLTADELRELSASVVELLARHRGRTDDPASRPKGARAVRAAALLFPVEARDS